MSERLEGLHIVDNDEWFDVGEEIVGGKAFVEIEFSGNYLFTPEKAIMLRDWLTQWLKKNAEKPHDR